MAVPEVPTCLIAVPTFRCPLRCMHCDLPGLRGDEVPPALWRQRLQELGQEVERPFLVGISGGEPLVYEGIDELVGACAEADMLTALATSTLPLTEDRARSLLAAGVNALVLPLDGIGLHHDELRRKPGMFERTVKAAQMVKGFSPMLHVSAVSTVTQRNADQLVSIAHWIYGQPETFNQICFHTLSGNLGGPLEHDPQWHRKSPLWPGGHEHLQDQIEQLAALAEEGLPFVNSADELRAMARFYARPDEPLRSCDQYNRGMLALPDGHVKICPLHDPVGNFREQSLLEIWRSPAARALRQEMRGCRRNCHFITNYAYQRHEVR